MIELLQVSKKFGSHVAVDAIDLSIHSGKITAFLGPNGAGKTTTIKMLVGLLRPTIGNIYIKGKTFYEDEVSLKKIISYIPDFPFVYDNLTGREFLEFVAGINSFDYKTSKNRIEKYLNIFDLKDMETYLIKNYSHGMRQRLVFCAALIKEPEILIIDEPMVGLDPKTGRIFKDVLLDFSSNGKLVFFSTHQLFVAEELCDDLIILHRGKILSSGPKKQLLNGQQFNNLEHLFLSLTENDK